MTIYKPRITTESFINRANLIHNNKYTYDRVCYVGTFDKVEIFCPIHSYYFLQTPSAHLHGQGCPKCGKEKTALTTTLTISRNEFICKTNKLYKSIYEYVNLPEETIKLRNSITIKCNVHNTEFTAEPQALLKCRSICPDCTIDRFKLLFTKTIDTSYFLIQAIW